MNTTGKVLIGGIVVVGLGTVAYFAFRPKRQEVTVAVDGSMFEPTPEKQSPLLTALGIINSIIPPAAVTPSGGGIGGGNSGGASASAIGKSMYAANDGVKVYNVDAAKQMPIMSSVRKVAKRGDMIGRVKYLKSGWLSDGVSAVQASSVYLR